MTDKSYHLKRPATTPSPMRDASHPLSSSSASTSTHTTTISHITSSLHLKKFISPILTDNQSLSASLDSLSQFDSIHDNDHASPSPHREHFLNIQPNASIRHTDYIQKLHRPPVTLSMKLRSEAAYVDKKPPTILRDYFPKLHTNPTKKLLNQSNVISITPMSGLTSIKSMESKITMTKKLKTYYKNIEIQRNHMNRLSGLSDTMANEILDYQVYPDRNQMTHPSTLCARCSIIHASLCIECAEKQCNESIELYRISRSEGSIHFFQNAIVQAGQKSITIFIIFRIWKNYISMINNTRRHMYVTCGIRYRRMVLLPIMRIWKEYTIECKVNKYKNELQYSTKKIIEMDTLLIKAKHIKEKDDAKLKSLKYLLSEKDKKIQESNQEIYNLKQRIQQEKQRVIHIARFLYPVHTLVSAMIPQDSTSIPKADDDSKLSTKAISINSNGNNNNSKANNSNVNGYTDVSQMDKDMVYDMLFNDFRKLVTDFIMGNAILCSKVMNPYHTQDTIETYLPSLQSYIDADDVYYDDLFNGILLLRFVIYIGMSEGYQYSIHNQSNTNNANTSHYSNDKNVNSTNNNINETAPNTVVSSTNDTTVRTRVRRRLRPNTATDSAGTETDSITNISSTNNNNSNTNNDTTNDITIGSSSSNIISTQSSHTIISYEQFLYLQVISCNPKQYSYEVIKLLFTLLQQLPHYSIPITISIDSLYKGSLEAMKTLLYSLIAYTIQYKSIHHHTNFIYYIMKSLQNNTKILQNISMKALFVENKLSNVSNDASISSSDSISTNNGMISPSAGTYATGSDVGAGIVNDVISSTDKISASNDSSDSVVDHMNISEIVKGQRTTDNNSNSESHADDTMSHADDNTTAERQTGRAALPSTRRESHSVSSAMESIQEDSLFSEGDYPDHAYNECLHESRESTIIDKASIIDASKSSNTSTALSSSISSTSHADKCILSPSNGLLSSSNAANNQLNGSSSHQQGSMSSPNNDSTSYIKSHTNFILSPTSSRAVHDNVTNGDNTISSMVNNIIISPSSTSTCQQDNNSSISSNHDIIVSSGKNTMKVYDVDAYNNLTKAIDVFFQNKRLKADITYSEKITKTIQLLSELMKLRKV